MARAKESEEQIRFHIDAALQVGDLEYLKHYLGVLGYKNLRNKNVMKLMPNQSDQLLEIMCKKGHVDMLQFVRENNLVMDPETYADKLGQNCLHLAVMKNQPSMISYLLNNYP